MWRLTDYTDERWKFKCKLSNRLKTRENIFYTLEYTAYTLNFQVQNSSFWINAKFIVIIHNQMVSENQLIFSTAEHVHSINCIGNGVLYRLHRNESIIMQSVFHQNKINIYRICIVKNRNESCFLTKTEWMYGWMKGCEENNTAVYMGFHAACVCVSLCESDWRRKSQSISHWFDNICSNKCFITSRSYTKCIADLAADFTTDSVAAHK